MKKKLVFSFLILLASIQLKAQCVPATDITVTNMINNSMTVLPDLLPIMIDMCDKKITGSVNLTNPGLISHNDILEMYREIVDEDFKWDNFNIDEQREILESERSNNFLDTRKLELLYKVKNIKDSVREILYSMKEKRDMKSKEHEKQ